MKHFLFLITALVFLSSCDWDGTRKGPSAEKEPPLQAVVQLKPLRQSKIQGEVAFTQVDHDSVQVFGRVTGLEANVQRAFHIHEIGDCGNNGENAGEHFNPTGNPHGMFDVMYHHAGDLPQLESNAEGVAEFEFTADSFSLAGEEDGVIGRALIVHAEEDKFTQPSGDAGARIACGVIQKKE